MTNIKRTISLLLYVQLHNGCKYIQHIGNTAAYLKSNREVKSQQTEVVFAY